MDEVKVTGLAELQKFLDEVPAKMEANIMRGALRAGMKVVQAEAKLKAPVKTGFLRDGLKLYTRLQDGKAVCSLRCTGKHASLAHWFEFTGTREHEVRPKGKRSLFIAGVFSEVVNNPGFSAKPFLRPALDSKAEEAVVAAGNYIKNRLASKEGFDTADIDVAGES